MGFNGGAELKAKKWLGIYLIIQAAVLILVALMVYWVDPWINYHKPLMDKFYYTLSMSSERKMNLGIAKTFDYDAAIVGTSMTENFKTSELDELFDVNSVKLCTSGANYKNLNEITEQALKSHPDTKMIIRVMDLSTIVEADGGGTLEDDTYPMYLINDNPLDDINYLLNKEALLNYSMEMVINSLKGLEPGITSFDAYANWEKYYEFGSPAVLAGHDKYDIPEETGEGMSEDDINIVTGNIEERILSTIRNYPNTEFYLIFSPYSVALWGDWAQDGELLRRVESQRLAAQLILESGCENVRLFSYSTQLDIVGNLDNYKDTGHYGGNVNSLMLHNMYSGEGLLTLENYEEYFDDEYELFSNYDYNSLFE